MSSARDDRDRRRPTQTIDAQNQDRSFIADTPFLGERGVARRCAMSGPAGSASGFIEPGATGGAWGPVGGATFCRSPVSVPSEMTVLRTFSERRDRIRPRGAARDAARL